MHHQPVDIHDGYHTIDPDAWVAQRTGDQHPEHTAALDDFLRLDVFAEYHPQMDTADRMQLWCAARGWTWLNDTEFIDAASGYITLTSLFDPERTAPYSRCRDCAAFDNGERDDMCPCDNPNVIYCPACQQRCRLELAEVPTYPQRQS